MINLKKALKGMEEVLVKGEANSDLRQKKIETAISLSQKDPQWSDFFWGGVRQFLGVKNYASCGDQSADCREGFGPRHGSIVFSIHWKSPVGENGIYLLKLCAENSDTDVCELLQRYQKMTEELLEIIASINKLKEFQED